MKTYRILIILLAGASIQATLAHVLPSNKNAMQDEPVIEVVVYQVKPEAVNTPSVLTTEVNAIISQMEGFVSRSTLQSSEDPTLLMDYVEWESLAAAKAAMEKAQSMPELATFFQSTTKIESMHHFRKKAL
ncbi:MAG TPA: hypothetical protein DCE41_31880 [Cytophagales bacterium]|nr:hypothetical protein [Cytophagales bacterium]HAA20583.1 hypothetical protein [Cytophagales bacterium]HAP65250.1 hypothetical protein [Cytophagales bacterium]